MPHDKGVTTPAAHRRTPIAELRAAVIRAHPDHGGTTEALQEALAALREERRQCEVPPPPTPPARPPHRRRQPELPRRTLRCAIGGALVTMFWMYGVVLPITLALALLVARANVSLIGS